MRFRPNMEGVTPIVAAVPPDSTRQGKDDAHGGNPDVRAGIGKSLPEVTVWVAEEQEPATAASAAPAAHSTGTGPRTTSARPILNAIVWIAHVDVPPNGVQSKRPTVEDLLANLDPKKRAAEEDR